ncbi:protein of unknown function [Cupriavidus neocaledonicus]|uniref:Uncharacterized protein n=1 Tax=Cupriavidus neocaledonicus TaxID=1040979 RepID=A0A375H9K9_9BURK|nr:protein of unknown function [Cupriavidus neocaledonicus]
MPGKNGLYRRKRPFLKAIRVLPTLIDVTKFCHQ